MNQVMKSKKAIKEEQDGVERTQFDIPAYKKPEEVIKIKPIETFNDWLIVLPFGITSTIELPASMGYQPFGVVIGSSQTIMANDGARVASCFKPGDVIRFFDKNIIDPDFKVNDPFYKDDRLVLITERNVICKVSGINIKVADGNGEFK